MLTALIKNCSLNLPKTVNDSQRIELSSGAIETIKWLALVLMTLDHINKYLFHDKLPCAFELGRVAMPLFAFSLAYNLARPNAMESGAYIRTMKRLGLYGIAATPFFIGLGGLAFGGLWPLNIMFMLLASTASIYLWMKGGGMNTFAAVLVFLIGGAFVEFWWFAMAFCIASWWYCKSASKVALLAMTLAAASLYVVNQNFWAIASIPLIFVVNLCDLKMPRLKYVFYIYYPAHLAVLLIFSNFMKVHV